MNANPPVNGEPELVEVYDSFIGSSAPAPRE
jgi:hypothetical protein